MSYAEQFDSLRRGTVAIFPEEELRAKLARGAPLRVKLGVDPTAPDIHLGHTVVLRKLRQFQDFGHRAILIIGDFTAMIGDPSGRSATRPPLTHDEVIANARTYEDQVFRILDRERAEVRYNGEWFRKFGLADIIGLCGRYTLARLLERDDFRQRYGGGQPIGLHELLYPLLQGYDSLQVGADVELGATDQTFNIAVGREIQRAYGQEGQVGMVLPVLEGTDGTQKMSKSLGNFIGITEPPEEMYGKIMSLSDPLMLKYYELLTDCPAARLEAMRRGELHPMECKKALAAELVERFHGREAAAHAERFFRARFQERKAASPQHVTIMAGKEGAVWICRLLKEIGFAPSTSQARRLIAQGAVRVDGNRIEDANFLFRRGVNRIVEVGRRRVARVELKVEGSGRPGRT